jgi:hypothetical protein
LSLEPHQFKRERRKYFKTAQDLEDEYYETFLTNEEFGEYLKALNMGMMGMFADAVLGHKELTPHQQKYLNWYREVQRAAWGDWLNDQRRLFKKRQEEKKRLQKQNDDEADRAVEILEELFELINEFFKLIGEVAAAYLDRQRKKKFYENVYKPKNTPPESPY